MLSQTEFESYSLTKKILTIANAGVLLKTIDGNHLKTHLYAVGNFYVEARYNGDVIISIDVFKDGDVDKYLS